MRTSVRLPSLVAAIAVVGVVLLAGCAGDRSDEASSGRDPHGPAPRLRGRLPKLETPPHRPMGRLERQLAARLSRQIAREGLTLEFLDCPRWDGVVPGSMACVGYVDGLVSAVQIRLTASRTGGAVGFDARLSDGLIATRAIERALVDHGLTRPDCGSVAAYPAIVGSRVTCRGLRSGSVEYVVATVVDRAGTVRIADYGDADAGG
jgi:hypothetical protein